MGETIVILEGSEIPAPDETGTGFGGETHSEEKALDKLERAWPMVMERLRRIVQSEQQVEEGGFALESVEFGISVTAGFDFVIAGTATADAKINFKRKG